jgi:hypothetical protein
MTIDEFLVWISSKSGVLYLQVWNSVFEKNIKDKLELTDIDEVSLIKSWKEHDKRIKERAKIILAPTYKKSIKKDRFTIKQFRTALEFIFISRNASNKYKLPIFTTLKSEFQVGTLKGDSNFGITPQNSIRTVKK